MLKASAYLMVSRKSVICAGVGGLRETGGLFERGAYHGGISSDLEYKVEKLKYKKLEVMEPRIKNKST